MHKYWFRKRKGLKTKDLGYGWIPVSWEGWIITLSMLALVIAPLVIFALKYGSNDPSNTVVVSYGVAYTVGLLIITGVFAFIAHNKTRP